MGGSVHEILKHVSHEVPQILINKDIVIPPTTITEGFDVSLLGDCDDVFTFLCQSLGWELQPKLQLESKFIKNANNNNNNNNNKGSLTLVEERVYQIK